MNEISIESSVERLESALLEMMHDKPDEDAIIRPSSKILEDIRILLNQIFPENMCTDIIYTLNTDKMFFGVKISPILTGSETFNILAGEDKMKLSKYKLEFDSKLVTDCNLSAKELMAFMLYEISSMMDSYDIIDRLRFIIDVNMTADDDYFSIRDSVNYTELVAYAIKDSLNKLSSILYNNIASQELTNNLIISLGLMDDLLSGYNKIIESEAGPGNSLRSADVVVLKWFFIMYRDMKTNSATMMETLKDAKQITGSKLQQDEIDLAIRAIDKIDATIMIEGVDLNHVFDRVSGLGALNEVSLFKALKQNGLRSIEDNLYELKMQIKNLETEDDALYVMRALSTRLNIITDYLYNTDLSDNERRHWEAVAAQYRAAREELVKKKIWNKKQYGIFIDYDQLDQEN